MELIAIRIKSFALHFLTFLKKVLVIVSMLIMVSMVACQAVDPESIQAMPALYTFVTKMYQNKINIKLSTSASSLLAYTLLIMSFTDISDVIVNLSNFSLTLRNIG